MFVIKILFMQDKHKHSKVSCLTVKLWSSTHHLWQACRPCHWNYNYGIKGSAGTDSQKYHLQGMLMAMQCCPVLPHPVDVIALVLQHAMLVVLLQWQQARAAPSLSPSLRASAAQRSGWVERGRGGMVRAPTRLLVAISPAPPGPRSFQRSLWQHQLRDLCSSIAWPRRHVVKRGDRSALVRRAREREIDITSVPASLAD